MVNLQQLPTLPHTSHDASFAYRHIGLSERAAAEMLKTLGYDNLDELIAKAIPDKIRQKLDLSLPDALVYRLHSVPGRNCPGQTRSLAQLPNYGH